MDIVDVAYAVKRLARNANILARQEIQRGAERRRQERATLVRREPADLPVIGESVHKFGEELGLGHRVGGVEGQHLRRNLLQFPSSALRIEEVLADRPSEALAPGVRTASLKVVRKALGRLNL